MGFQYNCITGQLDLVGASASSSTITNPSLTSTDNAAARFDGTTGVLLQNSLVIIDDAGNVSTPGNITLSGQSANRVAIFDGSKNIVSSSVTTTTLGFLDATSSIQTQLDSKIPLTQKGAALGVATLDAGGKVPVAQLPNSIMEFQGNWDASTNTPTLADGVGNTGDVYRVNVAGTQNLGSGAQTFVVGDYAIYDAGGVWRLAHSGADAVVSVNGAAGVVTVNAINQLTGDVTTTAASGSQSKATTVAQIQGTTVSGTTGTGNVAFSASPTFSGTLSAAAISASGTIGASNFSGSSSGTNTGDVTLSAFGSVPNANGASLSGQALTLQPANGSFPGGVSTTTQTFAGNKTFSGAIDASNLSGTNTGDQTITLTGDVTGSGTGSFVTTIANLAVTNAKIANATIDLTAKVTGVLPVLNGGTGQSSYTNGQLLIGNTTGNTLTKSTLTQGSGIVITNGTGTITIASTTVASAGDINETSFAAANNQSAATNVTGFAFANGTVRAFDALVSVFIDATSDLFEVFKIKGIQKGASWDMIVDSTGDDSGIVFSITTAGQIQYQSTNVSGFVSSTMKFRAQTLGV